MKTYEEWGIKNLLNKSKPTPPPPPNNQDESHKDADPYGEENWNDEDYTIEYLDDGDILFLEEKIREGEYVFIPDKLLSIELHNRGEKNDCVYNTICKVTRVFKHEISRYEDHTKRKIVIRRIVEALLLWSPIFGDVACNAVNARLLKSTWDTRRKTYLGLEETINRIRENNLNDE